MLSAEETFEGPESLINIESIRKPFIPAEKKIVQSLVADIPEGAQVLEIGAGTGNLRELLPDRLNIKLVQTDLHGNLIREQKRRYPETDSAVADVYRLPFGSDSLDAVMSLAAYDVFEDLEAAVDETARVLKEDGTFVHLIDFIPSSLPIIHDLQKRGVPFPYIDPQSHQMVGFYLVDSDQAVKIRKGALKGTENFISNYIEKPDEQFMIIHSRPGNEDQQTLFEILCSNAITLSEGQGEIVLADQYFQNKMERILKSKGLDVNFSGKVSSIAKSELGRDVNPYFVGKNVISNNLGHYFGYRDPFVSKLVGTDETTISLTVLATKATKTRT